MCIIGNTDATGLSNPFKAGGNVDAVAEDVAVVDDDIADMNSDTELDFGFLRYVRVLLGHAALDIRGTPRCINRACEFHQHSIACGLHYASAVRGDGRIYEGLSDCFELRQRAFFIRTHQAAVPGDIRCKHCC